MRNIFVVVLLAIALTGCSTSQIDKLSCDPFPSKDWATDSYGKNGVRLSVLECFETPRDSENYVPKKLQQLDNQAVIELLGKPDLKLSADNNLTYIYFLECIECNTTLPKVENLANYGSYVSIAFRKYQVDRFQITWTD